MDEKYIIANRTDTGRAREHNEDSMVTFDSPNGRVVAVCDGMGGQAAGDVASRLACNIIADILTNNTFSSPTEAITRAVLAANQGILHRASQNPELEGMGATCVIVIIKDGLVYYGWVGDSRIYYIANGSISQISRDQSYVQQLVDAGQITAAEAETHPQKNEITNALGVAGMTPPELCASPISPAPGSMILLCSDGLSGMVNNQTILSIADDASLSPQQKVDRMVDTANANGGLDNITVQLIQFSGTSAVDTIMPIEVGKKKQNWAIYIGCAVIVLIIIAIVYFLFMGKEESKQNVPNRIEDTRTTPKVKTPAKKEATPATTATPAPKKEQSAVNKTVVTEEKGKEKSKSKEKTGDKKKEVKNEMGVQEKTPRPKLPTDKHPDAIEKNKEELQKIIEEQR